jgi:hypothetical protein
MLGPGAGCAPGSGSLLSGAKEQGIHILLGSGLHLATGDNQFTDGVINRVTVDDQGASDNGGSSRVAIETAECQRARAGLLQAPGPKDISAYGLSRRTVVSEGGTSINGNRGGITAASQPARTTDAQHAGIDRERSGEGVFP